MSAGGAQSERPARGPAAFREIVARVTPAHDSSRLAVPAALVLEPRLTVEIHVPRTPAPNAPKARTRRPLPPGRDPIKAALNEALVLASWYRATLDGAGVSKEDAERRVRVFAATPGRHPKAAVRTSLLVTGIVADALERDPRGSLKKLEHAWLGTISKEDRQGLDAWADEAFKGFDGAVVVLGAARPGPRRRFLRAALSDFAAMQLFELVERQMHGKCVFLNLPLKIVRPGEPAGSRGTDPRHELYVLKKLGERGCVLAGLSGPLLERAAMLGIPALAFEPPRGSRSVPRMRDYAGRAPGWMVVETENPVSATSSGMRRVRRERRAIRAFIAHELFALQNMNLARQTDDPRLSERAQVLFGHFKDLSPNGSIPAARKVVANLARELSDLVSVAKRVGSTKRSSIDLGKMARARPREPEEIVLPRIDPPPEGTKPRLPPRLYYQRPRAAQPREPDAPAGFDDILEFANELHGLASAFSAYKLLRGDPKLDAQALQDAETYLRERIKRREDAVHRATTRPTPAELAKAREPAPTPVKATGKALWTVAIPKAPLPKEARPQVDAAAVSAAMSLSLARVPVVASQEGSREPEPKRVLRAPSRRGPSRAAERR